MIQKYIASVMAAAIGALFSSGYAFMLLNQHAQPWFEYKIRIFFFASLPVAVIFACVALWRGKTSGRVILLLIVFHVLWVQPIWGFHHDYTIGCFGWLFLGGENGFSVFPNVIGLPLTVAATVYILSANSLKKLNGFTDGQPNKSPNDR